MKEQKDIEWFKRSIAPILKDYEVKYRFYDEGDFGPLTQVVFNSDKKGGGVDFWGLGWLGIEIYNYETEEQLLNILIEPHQEEEKDKAFEELQELLQ